MNLNQILCMFLPAMLALYIYTRIINIEKSNKELVYKFFLFQFLIILFSYIIIVFIFKHSTFVFTEQFTIKYMLLSVFFIISLPIIVLIIEENVKITLEVIKK